jgi:rhodanese-related sulfurtransferase
VGAEAAAGKGEAPTQVEGATLVSPAEAKALWDRDVRFIDVRTGPLFEKGRIPGATFIDCIADSGQKNLQKVASPSEEIVIYCMGPG